ncbi:MAG: NAD(P)/FAD-dependent oxidoreductase [Nanoarchaeota archaeon]
MISIIGAGPAGGYLAKILAKKGQEVSAFEEHKTIGKPVQCTGIMSGMLADIIPIRKEFMVNTINKVRIHSPDKKVLELNLDKKNYVVDRTKFDSHFHDDAKKLGVKYYPEHRLTDFSKGKKVKMTFSNGETVTTDTLVGSDGYKSTVARLLGEKYKTIVGIQGRYSGKFDSNTFEVYLGYGTFGWSVPENESVSRIGLGSYSHSEKLLKEMIKDMNLKFIEWQSGPIPVYKPSMKLQHDNVFLLGDAAAHVKATTFGGIVYGLMGAEELANVLVAGGDYQEACKKRFGKDLLVSLYIHKIMKKFNKNDYNKLLALFLEEKPKKIIETYERDVPSQFLLKLIKAEPRLLLFLRKLF